MNLALSASFRSVIEPAVDGGSIAPGEFVGCVLLEVDDHLMGGTWKGTSWKHGEITAKDQVWKVTGCYRTDRPSLEDVTSHSYLIEVSRLT